MKKLIQTGLLLLLAATAIAQESSLRRPPEVLQTFNWKDLAKQFPNSQIVSMDGMSVLKIENTNGTWTNITLLTITNAAVIGKAPTIVCEIKTEHKDLMFGGLQLERDFPPLAMGGDEVTNSYSLFEFPLTQFNWHQCEFTVIRSLTYGFATQFELKMGFSGTGTIYIRPIKLLEIAKASNWWTPQQAGRIGGIGGAIIGCLGGLIGILGSKGKARNFVLATIKIFIALGIILLVAGVVAIALQQPYEVWYSLLLPGFILTLVFSLNLPSIQRRYDELEIRRMTSIDTMRS